MMRLNPHHILITGASSGIGAALAELYAGAGVRLSLQGRDEGRLNRVAARAQERGAAVTTQSVDVRDAAAMAAWVRECDALQPLDLVIANAGISAGTAAGLESAEQTKTIFEVNVGGVLNTVQPAIPLMTARGRGQIAVMSSLAGFRGMAGAPAYGASKAAVRVYGEGLRGALQPSGVAVNVICPGFVKTPMTDANRFPMPFRISAARAAAIIRRGLEANRPRIAFPWPMAALVHLFAALPLRWTDAVMTKLPKKTSM